MSEETTNKYLIEIETILKGQGADAAIAKLKELRAAQVDAAKAGKDTKGEVSQLDAALQALGSRTGGVRDVVEGTTQAMKGNEQAVFGLAKAVRALKDLFTGASGWLGIAALIGAGLTAALALVRKFRADAKTESEGAAADAKTIAEALDARLKKIGEMKMGGLRDEIEAITAAYSKARDEADRWYNSQVKITDAELGAHLEANRLAEAEGKLTPEQRARADQDARGAAEERKLDLRQRNLEERAAAAQATLSTAQPKLAELQGGKSAAERAFSEELQAAVASGAISREQAELGDFGGAMEAAGKQATAPGALGDPFSASNQAFGKQRMADLRRLQRLHRAREQARARAAGGAGLEKDIAGAGAELAAVDTEGMVLASDRAASRAGRRADMYALDAQTSAAAAGVAGPQPEESGARRAAQFVDASILGRQSYRGQVYGGTVGAETQRAARGALRDAVRGLQAPDSDDEAIIAELLAKWEKMGAKLSATQAQIRRALDLIDGKVELKDERSKAERAYTL